MKDIAFDAWLTYWGPVNIFDPVVASWPSMIVTLEEMLPEVVANEELTTEEVTSKLVTLVERLPDVVAKELDKFVKLVSSVVSLVLKLEDCAANEAEAVVKVLILVSSPVNLVERLADWAANDPEADVKVLEVASKFDVLMLNEADDWAYEAEVITYELLNARYELEIADEPVIPVTSTPFTINEPVMTALLINIWYSSFYINSF